jgi:dTDP-4-dehydrorhamnose reductase
MNILVFGKDGQLGRGFKGALDVKSLEGLHRISYVGRADCDLANPDALTALLNQMKPELIINAAAYTAVDRAETEIDLAYAINAKAPEIMAQYAILNGITLLHFSTDYVFDGSKDGFYCEDDPRNPLSIYGKSKAAGERAIEASFANQSSETAAQYAILRTSWVYGDGGNFIRTILRLAKEREALRIISDQHGVPTSAQWLAQVSLDLVLGKNRQITRFPSGIYHVVPSGQTTWYGLATLVVQSAIEAGLTVKAKPEAIKAIRAVEYPLPAPRPMNSRMATNRLQTLWTDSVDTHKRTQLLEPWEGFVKGYVYHLVHSKLI